MTMTAFLPFDRKPQKTIASMICKYSNMVAKPTTNAEWMFQGPVKSGRGSMLVQIVDFRDFLTAEFRDWADDVGWDHNWAIAISVSHKRRTNEEYAFWHAFSVILQNAYEGNGLASNEIWLSAEEEGFPTTSFTVEELLPDLISSEADDVSEPEEDEEQPEAAMPPPPPQHVAKERQPEPEPEPEPEPQPEPEPEPEPQPEPEPEIEEEEVPQLRLVPVDFEDEDDDDFEDEDEDDDDFEDEDDDDWDIEGEGSDAITEW